MTRDPGSRLGAGVAALLVLAAMGASGRIDAAGSVQTPEQFIGFTVGADRKLVRWDRIVGYMQHAAASSDRVRLRDLGRTSRGNPFIALEISSAETIKNLDRYKNLERKLYFQGGAPTSRERDEIFRQGKAVVLVTCSVHGSEIGATQMALELVHRLATDDSAATRKILDNVILVLVPSANPDGQEAVTDWYNQNVGTPFEQGQLPYLDHPYAGHDSNRDMYMFTQLESQYMARLAWHDWFPAVWLDQHQMSTAGPRMFVMPAADPINPNVHPLIYRWNGILGQSQAAALEAAGKDGIIYNSTYTNFWQGALAWSGWWHNQVGLLTEVASVRVASPIDQLRASNSLPRITPPTVDARPAGAPRDAGPLLPPSDVTPRTEYPRPWLGGRWTLRDIVDYELISTFGLLETLADRRETLLRQIYEVNRATVEGGSTGDVTGIVIPVEGQHDPREVTRLVERLTLGGVEVYRAQAPFDVQERRYSAGAFVIPMTQVFARYAKDLLEVQVYPEVRRGGPSAPVEPPYDVTAWTLGLLLGVDVDFVRAPLPAIRLARVNARPPGSGGVTGSGSLFTFDYAGAETALAINRLLKSGARVAFDRPSQVSVTGVSRGTMERIAEEAGLRVTAAARDPEPAPGRPGAVAFRTPRVAVYAPWTGGNTDEGWTRWVLEQHEFQPTTVHNADIRRGGLRQLFDVLIIPDQTPRDIVDGFNSLSIRPEHRGGIGEPGVENISRFIADGGTLVTLGAASDLAIDRLPVPVRNVKRALRRELHSAPGTILRLQVDTSQPLGYGVAANTYGFYTNGPFFTLVDGFPATKTTVVARYPAVDIAASGWLSGEDLMAGREAVVSVDLNPGRVVLFGFRPQHRGQTAATFPLLFNAIYLAAAEGGPIGTAQQ